MTSHWLNKKEGPLRVKLRQDQAGSPGDKFETRLSRVLLSKFNRLKVKFLNIDEKDLPKKKRNYVLRVCWDIVTLKT